MKIKHKNVIKIVQMVNTFYLYSKIRNSNYQWSKKKIKLIGMEGLKKKDACARWTRAI